MGRMVGDMTHAVLPDGVLPGNGDGARRARTNHFATWTPLFVAVLAFIGGVSIYDGYLVIRTGDSIRQFEKNPIGVYLLDCNDGAPELFLRVKAAGTLLVLTALSVLHQHSRRLASPIALALVLFQGGLLVFLEYPFS